MRVLIPPMEKFHQVVPHVAVLLLVAGGLTCTTSIVDGGASYESNHENLAIGLQCLERWREPVDSPPELHRERTVSCRFNVHDEGGCESGHRCGISDASTWS